MVGAPLQGKVLILDDVITAGTSVRESVIIIKNAHATPAGVLIALDRQEKGQNDVSAISEVEDQFTMPVVAIITLANIVDYLTADSGAGSLLEAIKAYQGHYGI